MSTLGGYQNECGGYHEYTGDVQFTGVSIQIKLFSQSPSLTFIMISPGLVMRSPGVLNTPQCNEHPQCTHDIPPVYS